MAVVAAYNGEDPPPNDPARDDDTLYILMTSHMVRLESMMWQW